MQQQDNEKTVILIGAGFGGMEFCRKFRRPDWKILLLDRQNHHLFQPLLYQVATAGLPATEIAQPIRAIFADREDITVVMEEATGIDLAAKQVITGLHRLSYDYLVIAAGARTGYFGNKEWERLAPGLKSLDDAMRVRREVLYAFERAETCTDPVETARLLTVVIVGGGPTGVEMAGALAELTRDVFRKNFRRIDPEQTRIILVDSNDRLLKTYPPELSEYALKKLKKMGVEVLLGKRVMEVAEDHVKVGDEILPTLNCIWAAGVEAAPLTRSLGVELDRAGRVITEKDCSVPGHPDVFVIGDAASLVDVDEVPVPGVAPAAMQTGAYVAHLLEHVIDGGDRKERPMFRYFDKGSMATIGRNSAVAVAGRVHMKGYLAWLAWLFVHLFMLVGLRNKISVFLSWVWSYVTFRHSARIITSMETRSPRRQQLTEKPQPGFDW
jgi:NADH:ubiquinone reductase (H+-translocating)